MNRMLLALLPAMTVPFLGALGYFVFFSEARFAPMLYTATKVFLVVWPLVALFGIRKMGWPQLGVPRRVWWHAALEGFVIGGFLGVMTWLGAHWFWEDLVAIGARAIQGKVEALQIGEYYLLFALFLSFIHSLLEEYYWRGFVFGSLRPVLSRGGAHFVAALAFSLHHFVVTIQFFGWGWGILAGIGVGFGGLLWSLLYERHGNLWGAWASHLMMDLAVMRIGYELMQSLP